LICFKYQPYPLKLIELEIPILNTFVKKFKYLYIVIIVGTILDNKKKIGELTEIVLQFLFIANNLFWQNVIFVKLLLLVSTY
jgi:hypothetical protein